MSIVIIPTKIKEGYYLLIPKTVVNLANVKDDTKFKIELDTRKNKPLITIYQKSMTKRKDRKN